MRINQTQRFLIATLGIHFFVILLLTSLTPMIADDFSYCFSFATGERIRTVGDIFESLKAHRLSMNGRMISHFLAMLFLLMPKWIFNVANAVNATFLLWLCTRYYDVGKQQAWLLNLLMGCTAMLTWIFMPTYSQVFLWLDGSLNYSWAMSFVMLFLLPYYREYKRPGIGLGDKIIIKVLFLFLAFLAGAYSENISCATLFMALCFLILIKRHQKKVPWFLLIAWMAGVLGFLFMMTAPAESGRAAQKNLIAIAKNIQQVVEMPQKALLPLFILYAVFLTIAAIKKYDKKVIEFTIILFLGSIVSIIVFTFAVYFPWHALCPATMWMIIADLTLLNELLGEKRRYLLSALTTGLAMYCAFSFVLAVGDVGVLYLESRQREAAIIEAKKQGQDPVKVHQYSSNTKYAVNYLMPDLYEDSTLWPNYDVAKYYDVPAISGLPPVEEFGSEAD